MKWEEEAQMAKNIVVCSDGTGNSAIKGRGTNVFKLFEAVDLNGHRTNLELDVQLAIYDDGVGTENFKPLKIFSGATGFGLSRNVRRLYTELIRIYDPGDRIYVFGFSRGAFTVRTLVGLISRCGLIDARKFQTSDDLESAVSHVYKIYRKFYRTALSRLFRGDPTTSEVDAFKKMNCHVDDPEVAFVGVWDTVDAVGTPLYLSEFINSLFYRFKFPDHSLSRLVGKACHALSIDDPRQSFTPVIWDADPRIEQVWFAGAHANVGGGYPKQGMSLVALDWMMRKARDQGLRMHRDDHRNYSEHGNVDDKLYDPRSGLGVFYRWMPRDIAGMCKRHKIRPCVHVSALERVAHGTASYAPGNIPTHADLIITEHREEFKNTLVRARAAGMQTVLRSASTEAKEVAEKTKGTIFLGRVAYFGYFGCGAGTALSIFNVRELMGLVAVYILSAMVERVRGRAFSRFWHKQQPALRTALKSARAALAGAVGLRN